MKENDKAELILNVAELTVAIICITFITYDKYSISSGYLYIMAPFIDSTRQLVVWNDKLNVSQKRNEIIIWATCLLAIVLNTIESSQDALILEYALKFILIIYPFQCGLNVIRKYFSLQP